MPFGYLRAELTKTARNHAQGEVNLLPEDFYEFLRRDLHRQPLALLRVRQKGKTGPKWCNSNSRSR